MSVLGIPPVAENYQAGWPNIMGIGGTGGMMAMPGIGNIMQPGGGNVFYVWGRNNSIGSDTNDGLSPMSPLLTITQALSMCVDDAQNYIVILSYSAPTGETWPINVNKETVHLIGAPGGGYNIPYLTPPGDTAALYIANDKVVVANLSLNGGATHGCIENNPAAARWGLAVDNCYFGVVGAAQDGIRNVAAGDNVYMQVTRCRFGYGLTRDGIRIEHNATRSMIGGMQGDMGNFFDRPAGVGVNVVGNGVSVYVLNNIFVPASDTEGKAVSLAAGATNCVVMGNVANFGKTAMAANPFLDAAGANANHWAANYHDITLTDPA